MSNLYTSFSVVFPLFSMMLLGYALRFIKVFNADFLRDLNNLCFKVFLPVLIFYNIYNSDFENDFSLKLIIFACSCVFISFTALMLLIPLIEKDNKRRGVIIQGIFRSNYILFGLPMTISLFGESRASVTAILSSFVVPLYNILSVFALELFGRKQIKLKATLNSIAKNPLIIASVFAYLFILSGLRLPSLLHKSVGDIAKIATPLSLIVLGGSFGVSNLKNNIKPLTLAIAGKLILLPAIFMPISVLLGFREAQLVALFAMFASPTAVSSFTMAHGAGADSKLAGEIVVMGSLLSIITIFLWVVLFKQLALI